MVVVVVLKTMVKEVFVVVMTMVEAMMVGVLVMTMVEEGMYSGPPDKTQ